MAPPLPVSARVWAQAIHAVTVQKMSLRRAAQLYGMHHMALYRRVRGQCMTSSPLQVPDDFQLTRAQEQAILEWLRQRYSHDQAVSSDEMRNVVRTIVSENERVVLPADFPSNRWIANFKRTHGLMRTSPPRPQQTQSNTNHAPASESNQVTNNQAGAGGASTQSYEPDYLDHENGYPDKQTHAVPRYPWRETTDVPLEVWEQAMEAVERHGMSLRNAAKAYGVHFAALYRRLKKKDDRHEVAAEPKPAAPELADYLPLDDEAAVIRVIHARAELGVLMTYEELVDLLHRTAMKYVHAVTTDLSNSLVTHFRNRVDMSVFDLIEGWPLPRLAALSNHQFQRQQEHTHSSPRSGVYFV